MWYLIFVGLVVAWLYLKNVKAGSYWQTKGVPCMKPWPIIGNMEDIFFQRISLSKWIDDIYKSYPNKRYVGIYQFYWKPTLLIRDIDLIKETTVKHFVNFPDHSPISTDADTVWCKTIVALTRKTGWQDMRATLSPAFSSSKMRAMLPLMRHCVQNLICYLGNQGGIAELDLKDAFSRCMTDVIGSTTFGVTCDSMKDPENEFYMMGKDATDFNGIKILKFFGSTISPNLMKLFNITMYSKTVKRFFRDLIMETIRIREEKGIIRPDMIHLLMEARKGRLKHHDHSNEVDPSFAVVEESEIGRIQRRNIPILTDDDITSQGLVFFSAGIDSIATTLCYIAYELAFDSGIQQRLYNEIQTAFNECGEITYEVLLGLKYLDCVVSETLRKWPPVAFTDRVCVKPFTIEPKRPEERALHVEKGTLLWIPIYPIHRDPEHYPDPEKFDPDRFSDENKHNIKPYTYMPFGSGPRNCIGSRYALLEMKLVIASTVYNFEIVPTEKTPFPLVLKKGTFIATPEGGFWLGLKSRKP